MIKEMWNDSKVFCVIMVTLMSFVAIMILGALSVGTYHLAFQTELIGYEVNVKKVDSMRSAGRSEVLYSTTYEDDNGKLYVVEGVKAYTSGDNVTIITDGTTAKVKMGDE